MSDAGVLGKYTLVAALGRGGTADVYLAATRGPAGFQKLVVLKRLRADHADDERYRAMLLEEARLAARLHHPNVVQTFEVGEDDGSYFLTMEYLDGQPLNRVIAQSIDRRDLLDRAVSVRIVSEVLAGLHYAHELRDYGGAPLGLVHRDVSPQNVFITYEGEVKLVDFGIAKAHDSTATETGELKGKIAYMSPEQALGTAIDRRVDLFATGIVLWELLARRRLFPSRNATATLKALVEQPIPSVLDAAPDVPPQLADIVARALERDVEKRYPTAAAMRDDLERYLEQVERRSPRRDELAARVSGLFAAERAEVGAKVQAFMRALAERPPDRPSARPPQDATVVLAGLPRLLPARPDLESGTSSGAGLVAPPPPMRSSAPPPSSGGLAALLVVGLCTLAVAAAAVAGFFVYQKRGAARRASVDADAGAAAPSSAAGEPKGEIVLRLAGSNTVGAELAPALIEAFFARRGASNVARRAGSEAGDLFIVAQVPGTAQPQVAAIRAEGTATAFDALAAGKCDIGMASRAINDAEAARLSSAGLGDMRSAASEHVVALDGVAVVVHPDNRVRALDTGALRRIFAGEARDWSAFGGTSAPIHLFARDDKSGTFDTFKHLVLADSALATDAVRLSDSAALSDKVAADPAAVGFVGLAYVRSARAVAVGAPGGTPMIPSPFTVLTEDYVLSRRLYFYTGAPAKNALAQDLVAFALSAAGQAVVRAQGFVDLEVDQGEHQTCGARCPPRYLSLTRNARRLSLDFRFRTAQDELDSRATRDVDRLVTFLGNHRSGKLLLFGFSDAVGSDASNLRLSRERAEAVNRELAARGVRASAVEGFGSELPVASNDDPQGREKNRRVEVWFVE